MSRIADNNGAPSSREREINRRHGPCVVWRIGETGQYHALDANRSRQSNSKSERSRLEAMLAGIQPTKRVFSGVDYKQYATPVAAQYGSKPGSSYTATSASP